MIFLAGLAHAAIYVQQDKGGNLTYSDTPLSDSAKTVTPPSQTFQEPPAPPASLPVLPLPPEAPKPSYTHFAIVSPKDQETIQNQPEITFRIDLKPELQQGDRLQLLLDNQPVGDSGTSTQITLKNVSRGTHEVRAVIMRTGNTIIQQSNTITLYVHRITPQSPAR